MADSYPYISGVKNITNMVTQLRSSFPATISSETVKKLGFAPKNESYVINALQFVGIIDEKGKKTTEAKKTFSIHRDEDFREEFSKLVEKAYHALFELHGDKSWTLETDGLITFFRNSDQTSDAVGTRQAKTFIAFAGLSGQRELPATRPASIKKPPSKPKTKPKNESGKNLNATDLAGKDSSKTKEIGLTVRIEINLPADGTKDTYDNIFKSIKENLINE